MANARVKLSSFPEVNDIQAGDMFPLLSGGNTNAKIDYATLADAIIAKLKSETGDSVLSINGKTGAVTLSKADVGLGNVDNTKDADKNVASAQTLGLISAARMASANLPIKGDGKIRFFVSTKLMTEGKPKADGYIVHFAWDTTEGWDSEFFVGSGVEGAYIQFRTQQRGVWGDWIDVYSSKFKPSKGDIGLGNVDNTKDVDKPISTAMQAALDKKADKTLATASANGLMSAVDKKAIDREFFRMLPKGGTYIPAKADLNSIEYIKVGNYYNSSVAESATIKNIPVQYNNAFIMYVLSPLSTVYDNESTARWVYRLRIFITFTGNDIFVQKVSSDATAGNFSYDPWVKMTNSNDLDAVSNTINTHIANKSNPHAVTKAQVGLGSVANLDQSKAIKSITRSGTTFTATALDGTTTTFTQQDNNTTYGIATSSADGLMSKTDKAKLDGVADQASQFAKNTAQIETAGTATSAHSVGEYVMISNALYKVTASVAKGDTWTIGTNVTAANIGSEIGSLKSNLANHSALHVLPLSDIADVQNGFNIKNCNVVIQGKIVLCWLSFGMNSITIPTWTDFAIAKLKSGYYPAEAGSTGPVGIIQEQTSGLTGALRVIDNAIKINTHNVSFNPTGYCWGFIAYVLV